MAPKVYIEDDKGREFANLMWAMSDMKSLVRLNLAELNRVQYRTQPPPNKHWADIRLILRDVKDLRNALLAASVPSGAEIFDKLNLAGYDLLGRIAGAPDFTQPYFAKDYFLGDLEDLERLLYFLMYGGITQVHVYCA